MRLFVMFAVVGAFNALLDFFIYNYLTSPPFCASRLRANVIATSITMTLSFIANLNMVFSPERALVGIRIFKFILVTGFSAYVIQNVVIWGIANIAPSPTKWICSKLANFPVFDCMGGDFLSKNLSKSCAVSAGLIWNFLWYRFYVYA